MKTFIKIILFLLFSNCAFAYCDFEIVKMESGMHALAAKTDFIQNIPQFGDKSEGYICII